jgi:hypothetical protein
MDQKQKISPLIRIFAGFMAVVALIALLAELHYNGLVNWHFLVAGSGFLLICLYVSITGRSIF